MNPTTCAVDAARRAANAAAAAATPAVAEPFPATTVSCTIITARYARWAVDAATHYAPKAMSEVKP